MSAKAKARIIGLGSYLPQRVLTNSDLEAMVETSDEWITTRTGMKERRIAEPNEFPSDMGAAAAKIALEKAGILPGQVDLIIAATMTPDYLCPSTAALIQTKIGASGVAAMDLEAACTGYLYALSAAKAFVESGMYRCVLVVATEKMSAFMDYTDRTTCVLFGDGASAAVVASQGPGFIIDTVCLGADGELAELLIIPAGGAHLPGSSESVCQKLHSVKMNGKEIFRHAVRRMEATARQCLEQAGFEEKHMSWLVPHQANLRIINAIAKQMEIPDEKVFKTVHKYGNTSASSIAIALDELQQEHKIKNGEHLLLVAFGGGLTWGASILTRAEN